MNVVSLASSGQVECPYCQGQKMSVNRVTIDKKFVALEMECVTCPTPFHMVAMQSGKLVIAPATFIEDQKGI